MKHAPWLVLLVAMAALGCNPEPRPGPGLSALRVTVVARPKSGTPAAQPSVYDIDTRTGVGDFEKVDYSDLHDIVIWVERADDKNPPRIPATAATIELGGAAPALSGVACVGQTIALHNGGLKSINAYSVSDGNQFNLGAIAPFQQASYVIKAPGLIEVLSDSSAAPIARVYAAPTWPAFISKSGGIVDFNDLPPGHYLVVSWHPRLPGAVTEIDLSPDSVGHASVDVGVNSLPKIGPK